jgi:hypothetical protein
MARAPEGRHERPGRTTRRINNSTKTLLTGLLGLWVTRPTPLLAMSPIVSFSQGVLTLKTSRYELLWQNGSMVSLRSFLPRAADLTVRSRPMLVEQLPNGLGSFDQHLREGKAQHHPWGTIHGPFLAQHPPGKNTRVQFQRIPGGARLTYRGLEGDDQAVLVQQLVVEPSTGDLVLRQEGKSARPGVFGAAFSLLNLKPDISFDVPYFGGQRWRADSRRGVVVSVAWPRFWNAGLIVGEVPTGGTFAVWAEDPQMHPKYLRRCSEDQAQALGFEACSDGPYDDKYSVSTFGWHFNTYSGSWMEPAERYKSWFITTHATVPRKQRPSRWIDNIALIWPGSMTEPQLKQMSQTFDPRKTLLMDWGWLKDFNRRIPDYRPRDSDFAQRVALAHRYGYHVGVYTSMALLDREANPTFMQQYGLRPCDDGLWKESSADAGGWLAYVHPGSKRWRDFYSDRMRQIVNDYGVDYLYQDIAGSQIGSYGLVDGLSFSKAVVAAEAAIRARTPRTALGGEYWTEVNASQEDFGVGTFLAWGGKANRDLISRPDQPHPLLSYLFSDHAVYWPHQTPIRDTLRFHQEENINEVVGALPVWATTPDDQVSEARVTLERARLWASGFRPYFPRKWQAHVASYMRDPNGRVVKYVRRGDSTYCYDQTPRGDRLRYARATGVTRLPISVPVTIDGWVGYGSAGPIGLDPNRWYCVFAGAPPEVPARITALPEGAWISGTRTTDEYCLVDLQGQGQGQISWDAGKKPVSLSTASASTEGAGGKVSAHLPTSLLFTLKKPAPVTPGGVLPLAKWHHVIVSNGLVIRQAPMPQERAFSFDGKTLHGSMVLPPLGGAGSEYSIDGFIHLPDDPRVTFQSSFGLLGGPGDGVDFVVRVNGKEIWRQFRESKAGWVNVDIPLKAYAGQDVVLSLAVDCGPSGYNTSCDDSVWGDPRITIAN